MGIDLRLTGAMMIIAYIAFVFISQSLSPLARSRRRVRRLQLWYARSIAVVLILSSLVALFVPIASLKEGVVLASTTAILPLAAVSLMYSAVVLKRIYGRWRGHGTSAPGRSDAVAPLSLAELADRDNRNRQADAAAPQDGFDAELGTLNNQLEQDLNEYQDVSVETDRDERTLDVDDRVEVDSKARQRRA